MAGKDQGEATISDLWHYAVGSERKGPVTEATLGKLLASGEISAETYVWQPGMDNWVHLADVPALKRLVSGVGADAAVEAFVEEDTTFTSPEELLATHSALEVAADTPQAEVAEASPLNEVAEVSPLNEDTIVEVVDDSLLGGAASAAVEAAGAGVLAGDEGDGEAELSAAATVAAADAVDGLFGAAEEELADDPFGDVAASGGGDVAATSGVDIFGESEPDDVFGAVEAGPVIADSDGVHSRHANSVLFSLDELGRDEAGATDGAGGEPYVTDTSGLIDIKAIADSQQTQGKAADPFANANLVIPPRTGTIAVPIVERRRGAGPWILVAALVLLIGGGVFVYTKLSGQSEADIATAQRLAKAEEAARAAEAKATAAAAAAEEAKAEAEKKALAEAARLAAEAKAAKELAAKKAADEAKSAKAAEAAEAAEGDPEQVAAASTKPKTTRKTPRKTPKKTSRKASTSRSGPKEASPSGPKPSAVVAAAPPKRPSNTTGTRKVNALLEKLNKPGDSGSSAAAPAESNLPQRLTAASLRTTLKRNRSKFAACGNKIQGSSGSVRVSTSFVIQGSSGRVKSARIVNGGGTSAQVQRCVVSALKNTTFGRFKEATMTVNYPIQLL